LTEGGLIEESTSLGKVIGAPILRVLISIPYLENHGISDTGKIFRILARMH
jgi:hypothetical protein